MATNCSGCGLTLRNRDPKEVIRVGGVGPMHYECVEHPERLRQGEFQKWAVATIRAMQQAASHQVLVHNSLVSALERFNPDIRAEYERIVRRGNPWDDERGRVPGHSRGRERHGRRIGGAVRRDDNAGTGRGNAMTETHIPEDDIQTLCGKDVRSVEMPAWDEETGDFSPATCPICRERIQLSPPPPQS